MMNHQSDSRTLSGPRPTGNTHSFVLHAGTDDELVCVGYRTNIVKKVVSFVFSILSLGALQLVFYWKPDWHLGCTCSVCPLESAQYILLKNQFCETFVTDVKSKNVAENPFEKPLYSGVHYNRPSSAEMEGSNSMPTEGVGNSEPSVTAYGDAAAVMEVGSEDYAEDDDDEEDTTALLKNSRKEFQNSLRYFVHQKVQYLWNVDLKIFEPLGGLEKCTPCSDFYRKYKGYNEEQQCKRSTVYGQNTIDIEVKSYGKLFAEEILNPFYMFQIFSIILWFSEVYYYYAACIVVILIVSLTISLYETRRQAITLRDMVAHQSKVTVLRQTGETEEIECGLLVPGDVLIIPASGCFMSCDAVLISGNCIVNESMLTGESVPVTKTPVPQHPPSATESIPYYSPEIHKRHTLFCGTQVIQTRYYGNEHVKAVVVRTGFSTMKGELVRSILFPKPIGFKFYQDGLKFIGLLSMLAVVGIIYTVTVLHFKHNSQMSDIIFKALDIVTVAVPPSLPAAMTIGTVYAQNRLKKHGVFCISPQRINVCGKLKLICFDKTGTLTEDGLDLWGVVPLQDHHFLPVVQNVPELHRGPFLAAMATCHSLTKIDGELMGDPLDLKMFEATNWLLEEPGRETTRFDSIVPTIVKPTTSDTYLSENIENPYEIGILRQFPFSSSLQRMCVITRTLDAKNMEIYVKGSPEMVAAMSKKETLPLDFQDVLENYTQQGFRVIALAWRPMDPSFSWRQAQHISRTDVECNLTFLGLLIMQNALKPETAPIIRQLIDADIRTVMVTGDNMLTAVSVARDCGMVSARSKVIMINATAPGGGTDPQIEWNYDTAPEKGMEQNTVGDVHKHNESYQDSASSIEAEQYHFAISGKSFAVLKSHFSHLIPKIVQKGTVYARMSPDQKTQLVESLQELGYCVGMCGDGANDCGALKAAHAGISLSEAEASVASPFTSKTPNISCVPTVIREGRAALVSSFGVFKYMALYSVIQFVTVVILYWIDSNLGDFQFLYIDLVITTTVAILMGRNNAYPKLVKQRPPGSLLSPTILLSILVEVVIVTIAQVGAYFSLYRQSWFVPLVPSHDADKNIKCYENTVVFFVSSFQYIILAGAFAKGKPYRQPIWTNKLFLLALMGLASFTALLMFLPVPWTFLEDFLQTLQLATEHMQYTLFIGGIIAANFVISFILESFVVDSRFFRAIINPLRCKKQPKNLYKRIENAMKADPDWPPVGTITTLRTYNRTDYSHSVNTSPA